MPTLRSSTLAWLAAAAICAPMVGAAETQPAADAVNGLGVDLYRQIAPRPGNLCLSPYSISAALAMTYAGAEGETRTEMGRVLHWSEKAHVDGAFANLGKALAQSAAATEKVAQSNKKRGGPVEPIKLAIANRLFPQSGFALRPEFLSRVKESYGAAPEPVDFKRKAGETTKRINQWVAKETRDRIRDLIPQPLSPDTRLVLANAVYFKAPWADEFSESSTKPEPFHLGDGAVAQVPTMRAVEHLGYAKSDGYTAVALPYIGGELQFVVLLPDAGGLDRLEKEMKAETWQACARMQQAEVDLRLPKFKFEPPTIPLADELKALGMKTAFDVPSGSANFDRMAPRKPEDYLAISEVFHKTFIAVDEKGTEAAAATAVVMMAMTAMPGEKPKPIEVKVDRPFLYAIQHVPSGACLFIGRVSDPR